MATDSERGGSEREKYPRINVRTLDEYDGMVELDIDGQTHGLTFREARHLAGEITRQTRRPIQFCHICASTFDTKKEWAQHMRYDHRITYTISNWIHKLKRYLTTDS